jgi:toxin ParE1/3/4
MRRSRTSEAAKADLREIKLYIARENPAAARRVLARLRTKIALVARLPDLGRVRDDLPGELATLGSVPDGNYVIYHHVTAAGGVEVARVLHGARDQVAALLKR